MMHKVTYAGRLERLFANLIDSMIMLLPATALVALGGTESALALIGSFLCNIAYYVAFTASSWQATPGKRMLGIHIARLDGKLLNERDALERFLAYTIPTLPLYLSVAPQQVLGMATLWLSIAWFAPIILRDDRRGVHDVICGTHVLAGRK